MTLSIATVLLVAFGTLLLGGAVMGQSAPTIASDLPDYNPGGTVTLTGTGWAAGEAVRIVTNDTIGQTWQRDVTVTAASDGTVKDVFQLPNYFVSNYDVTASGTSGTATTTFTDANPSANLDQCANDPLPSSANDGCDTAASQWVNGNLGSSKSVYFEGDSIPYRLTFDNLTLSSHTVTIEWDTTKSSTHALDYLTTFNQSVLDANPCLGVSGCNPGTFTTFAIPADPQVTGAGVTPIAGVFTFYGATITNVSAYSYADGTGFSGDKSARITITFTPGQVNPVLAWGGHISSRKDWGANNSAVAISGSPYHTRLIDLDGSGGNQDRSLSADAVIFPGSVTIIKDANPNGSTSFGFTASPAPLANFSLVDDGTSANTKVFSNITNFQTYTVVENAVSGWGLTGITCSVTTPNGGNSSTNVGTATATINMAEGENYTCTFTNVQQTGTLTVIKHVINDNGGTATANQWSIHVKSGSIEVSGSPQAGSESGTTYTLNVGTYTASETGGPSGYAFVGFSGDCDSSGNVTLAAGQSKTCTLTNNDQTAHLKLVKTVTNDNGGTAAPTDFTLSASGPTPLSGAGGAESDVNAGTYALSETNLPGYTAGSWSCSGGTQNGASVTLALGQSATCTINNNDNAAHLKLVKTVTNDNGGAAVATDFTLSAAGPTPLSGAGGAESDVNAGSYTLSETNLPGYTAGSWNCSGGTQNGASVTLALGQSATCTINNNDNAAHLKLVKTVTNDNGGTALATDFTLSATGPTPLSGAGGAESNVNAGTYTLSETNLPGYTAGSWSCSGGTFTAPDQIALALGQSATCTINNNDQTAHLTLVKVVVNDNGGTAAATDFTLSAAGPTPLNGAGGASSDVNAGTYTLNETGPAGYSTAGYDCGASVTLAVGESKTCTITNDDIAPKLHLRKVVVNDNGGTATVADFTLTANGTGSNDLSGTSPVDSGAGLKADTFALSESGPAGYAASAWSCVGGTQNGSNITVRIGGEATCTITNNDIAPKLHLRKVVINDNGGTKTVADFTLTANGTGTNDLSGTSPVDSGAGLQADTWALSETNVYGYSASAWSCVGGTQNGSNITVGIGGEATCTITNNDQPGTIIIKKITKPANTGSFAFTTTGTGYTGFTIPGGGQNSQTLNAGTYTVAESTQLGWILTGIGQDPADPNNPLACAVTGSGGSSGAGNLNTMSATISLKNGDTVTCVFENTGQGTTRTQGFWATHTPLANIAWFGGLAFGHTFPGVAATAGIGDTTICGRPVDTLGKLMGGFWSSISSLSTGAKRSALDQARMQLLQQLLAAELNASAFGSVPAGGSGMFAQWESALCGTNTTAIKNAQQQAASFNTQGDSSSFTPGTSADSKYARSIADIKFWDVIKP